MGSKDAIAKFALAMLNPGDLAIVPRPGYPTYNIGHIFAGAVSYQVPLLPENGFLVDFDAIPGEVRRLAKMLWLNYPNNPTTAVAPLEFFERAVEFGRRNNILIAHDSAYSENTYDGYKAPSILQVDGRRRGGRRVLLALQGVQHDRLAGRRGGRQRLRRRRAAHGQGEHRQRHAAGHPVRRREGAGHGRRGDPADQRRLPAPPRPGRGHAERERLVAGEAARRRSTSGRRCRRATRASSAAFATDLLEKTGVVVTPGLGYGQWGEGYFRISLTYPDDVLREALERIAAASI